MTTENTYYVQAILDGEIIVFCDRKEKINFLKEIGAKREWFIKKTWKIKFETKEQMFGLLMKLNLDGAAFSYDEHGWGSSCVFIHYRDKGLVSGEIKEIFWIAGGKFRVTVK